MIVAGCGGGGGGGSGSMSRHPPSFFETAEYLANRGLEGIEASSAYAAGATGNGIMVGVVDTGVDLDHPEFAAGGNTCQPVIGVDEHDRRLLVLPRHRIP